MSSFLPGGTSIAEPKSDTPLDRAVSIQKQNFELIATIRGRINRLRERLRVSPSAEAGENGEKGAPPNGILVEHLRSLEYENSYLSELLADLRELEDLL